MNLRQLQEVSRGQGRIAIDFSRSNDDTNSSFTMLWFRWLKTIRSHTKIALKDARKLPSKNFHHGKFASPEKPLISTPIETVLAAWDNGSSLRPCCYSTLTLLLPMEPNKLALDVTIPAEILQLLLAICRDNWRCTCLNQPWPWCCIKVADRTLVMYAGRVVEEGPTLWNLINDSPAPLYSRLLNALATDDITRSAT